MQNKDIKSKQNNPLRRKRLRFNDEAAVDGLSRGGKVLSTRMLLSLEEAQTIQAL